VNAGKLPQAKDIYKNTQHGRPRTGKFSKAATEGGRKLAIQFLRD